MILTMNIQQVLQGDVLEILSSCFYSEDGGNLYRCGKMMTGLTLGRARWCFLNLLLYRDKMDLCFLNYNMKEIVNSYCLLQKAWIESESI